MKRDLFISYASEDRETVAKPLADMLEFLGLKVWFDQFDLKLGDNLRKKIDEGLINCRFGVVILSKSFFSKHYTNHELDGLAQKEIDGNKVILPIWLDANEKDVREFSPPLANKIAVKWDEGIMQAVAKIIEVVKPDIVDSFKKVKFDELVMLESGKELSEIISGCEFSFSHYDEPENEEQINLVGGFLDNIKDWCDAWNDIEISEQMKASLYFTEEIKTLKEAGWSVFGKKN